MKEHLYTFMAVIVLTIAVMIYLLSLKDRLKNIKKNSEYYAILKKKGVEDSLIDDLQYDEDSWYYKGNSLCYNRGIPGEECSRHNTICKSVRYRSVDEQFDDIIASIRAYRNVQDFQEDPLCPLL